MHLYRTTTGFFVHADHAWFPLPDTCWDSLIAHADLQGYLAGIIARGQSVPAPATETLLAPIGTQEVWAAGVTYFRSRTARMEESKDAGGGSFTTASIPPTVRRSFSKPPHSVWPTPVRPCTCAEIPNGWCQSPS